MAMLREYQNVSSADLVDTQHGKDAAENVTRVAGTQNQPGKESPFSSELAAIAMMTYSELHLAWRRHYRTVSPKKISRDILQLGIAWKIQESRLGGLSVSMKRQIAALARTMEAKSDLAKPRAVSPKPGARLLRTWEGVTHEVMVVEDGFLWAGKTWASLSAIARQMTGTRWSGPRFFGLIATIESNASEQKAKASDHE